MIFLWGTLVPINLLTMTNYVCMCVCKIQNNSVDASEHLIAQQKYIHNWTLQPFSEDYWAWSLTPLMLCVLILYINGGTYSLKLTSNDRFFEKLFMAILFQRSDFLPEICWNNYLRILFWCLAWDSNPGIWSNKPKHYLLDHADLLAEMVKSTIITTDSLLLVMAMLLNQDMILSLQYIRSTFFGMLLCLILFELKGGT